MPMIRKSLFLVYLLWISSLRPATAQEVDSLRLIVPVIDTATMDRCSWADLPGAEGRREPILLADATWVLPAVKGLTEGSSSRSLPSRAWVNADTTFWLQAERGPLARHPSSDFSFGPWTKLATTFYFEGDKENLISISCTHCTEITDRCHSLVQGRVLIVAWGGGPAISKYTRTAYQSFAAFELGKDDWLVIWGGGRRPEANAQVRSLVHSVHF
jgi:hypothetical protein